MELIYLEADFSGTLKNGTISSALHDTEYGKISCSVTGEFTSSTLTDGTEVVDEPFLIEKDGEWLNTPYVFRAKI